MEIRIATENREHMVVAQVKVSNGDTRHLITTSDAEMSRKLGNLVAEYVLKDDTKGKVFTEVRKLVMEMFSCQLQSSPSADTYIFQEADDAIGALSTLTGALYQQGQGQNYSVTMTHDCINERYMVNIAVL